MPSVIVGHFYFAKYLSKSDLPETGQKIYCMKLKVLCSLQTVQLKLLH